MSVFPTDHDSAKEREGPAPITVRIREACRLTGIGRSKLYELIGAGELEVVKVGSLTLIPVANLERLVGGKRPGSYPVLAGAQDIRMHAFLMQAILTGSIANLPASMRRQLASSNEKVRVQAEDAIVEQMIAALRRTD
jgi:excisionase family DNA binding protein